MEKIFQNIKTISLIERIKIMFIKTRYYYDFENRNTIKYKLLNGTMYILKIESWSK